MKIITFFLMLTNSLLVMAQQIDYYPEQKPGVSDEDYKYGVMVLEETYEKVKQEGGAFNYADYWNIAIAYYRLKEAPELFREMLYKSKELNAMKFAEIFIHPAFGGTEAGKWEGYLSAEEYKKMLNDSRLVLSEKEKGSQKSNSANQLVAVFEELRANDNKYRKYSNGSLGNMEKQKEMDDKNLAIVDSLFNSYKRYIGKSLVGDDLGHVMWSVIQHSNITAMEKYLPVIHSAVLENELNDGMLKLLLDRIYLIKCKYQIYGTQANVPLGSEDEIAKVKARYELCPAKITAERQFQIFTHKTNSLPQKNKKRRLETIRKPWKE